MQIIEGCSWAAETSCQQTPDPQYDALLPGYRWCAACGPKQIERQALVAALIAAGYAEPLQQALESVEARRS